MNLRYFLGIRKKRLIQRWRVWQQQRQLQQQFRRDWQTYEQLSGTPLVRADSLPQLYDRTSTTAFNADYFYQPYWLANALQARRPALHVDVGSQINMLNVLSVLLPVVFVEIRPLEAVLPDLHSVGGSILELPFASQSIPSLSSLHVVEHIGLGRYGDALNPHGTQQALAELCRVVAQGGKLYISTPIGQTRIHFNAHRIHTPEQIIAMCDPLRLVGFGATDGTAYHPTARWQDYQKVRYACGFFEFER